METFGPDTRLLVKLLDPGQRLPVHAHPSAAWASEHVARAHGKVEAWYILSPGTVHIGLKDDVAAETLAALVETQDTDGLLALLHEVPVEPNDVVFVPAGELHAIGEGVLIVELQEPEDLSILLEWRGFELDGAQHGHLGVGFDLALTAVNHHAVPNEGLKAHAAYGSVFPAEADPFFRLERIAVDGEASVARGFSVLVVTEGEVRLGDLILPRGRTVVIPDAAGRPSPHRRAARSSSAAPRHPERPDQGTADRRSRGIGFRGACARAPWPDQALRQRDAPSTRST